MSVSVQLHSHRSLINRTITFFAQSPLPPLSKGGGLTARYKLLLYCVLLATHPPFLFAKLFCRQDGGIAPHPHHQWDFPHYPSKKGEVLLLGQAEPTVVGIEVDRTSIPPTFRRVRVCVCLVGFASLPCLLLPLQRTSPCSHNHCKRTTHHRSAQRPCLPCQREVAWRQGTSLNIIAFTCDTPAFFIHQTFLSSRRKDCHTNIPHPHQLFKKRTIPRL